MASSKVPVIVVGPNGKKLGRPVVSALVESDDCVLVGGVTRPNQGVVERITGGHGAVIAGSFAALARESPVETLPDSTVVFYAVKGDDLIAPLKDAVAAGFRTHVIGSTAIPDITHEAMRNFADNGQVVLEAPNFSEEAVVGDWVVEKVAAALRNHDAGVQEVHHGEKADVPSGTARMWGESIARGRGQRSDTVFLGAPGAGGQFGRRSDVHDVHIVSRRLGGVPGEHEAMFASQYGALIVTQRAYSSKGFAQGALRAMRWAAGQEKPSFYTMRDVMGLL
ncbi:MAG: hypothetical protein HYS45_03385 [Parcubacteria group bacterium]|nr:hypothetical protein [Parcubacteria group bacterium]